MKPLPETKTMLQKLQNTMEFLRKVMIPLQDINYRHDLSAKTLKNIAFS